MPHPGLFLWKSYVSNFLNYGERTICPCCHTPTDKFDMVDYDKRYAEDEVDDIYECALCGWYYRHTALMRDPYESPHFTGGSYSPILCEFLVRSLDASMQEMAAKLNASPGKGGNFAWSEYEAVAGEVLTENGFKILGSLCALGNQAHVLALSKGTDKLLLQCRRKEEQRGAVIAAVRVLAGVAIDWDCCTAYLAMTPDFASLEKDYLDVFQLKNFATTLEQASEFLKLLDVYNNDWPSLDKLIPEYREARIRRHRVFKAPRYHAVFPS